MKKLINMGLMSCFVIGATVLVATAQAQQVGSAQRGLRLARNLCADCHLVVKEAGRSSIPQAPPFSTIAMTPGLTDAALTAMLQSSHRTMPNIVIKGGDIADIVAYILSLKEND